jgi:hypothetical protein
MRRLFTVACLAALAAGTLPPLSSRAEVYDFSPFAGLVVGVPVSYDVEDREIAAGLDANFVAYFFNAGVSFRHWSNPVEGWDKGETIRNEFTGYAGIGIVNLLQIQAGLSATGASLRLRSDIVLFGDEYSKGYRGLPGLLSSERSRWGPVRQGIVVSPFLEVSPWHSGREYVFGAGLGVMF